MHHKFKFMLLSALVGLAWLMPLHAQEESKDSIARLAMITAKDGHSDDLLEAITEYHHWIGKLDGHMEYTWYRILTGPNTGKFLARTPGHQWADFDAKHSWDKEAGEMFQKLVAPHIEHSELQYTSEMTEYSHWPESFDGYTHFAVTDWYIHNGQGRKFRQGLKKIVDTLKAGGFPNYWGFYSIESGGRGNQIRIVGANKGWSDMVDEEPSFYKVMSDAMGGEDEVAAFMSDWSSTFKPGLSQMVELIPEASDYGNK